MARRKQEDLQKDLEQLAKYLNVKNGRTVKEVAEKFAVNPQTARDWLDRIQAVGICPERKPGQIGRVPMRLYAPGTEIGE